jgi:hypothetical protein
MQLQGITIFLHLQVARPQSDQRSGDDPDDDEWLQDGRPTAIRR